MITYIKLLNYSFYFLEKISYLIKKEKCLCCSVETSLLPFCKSCFDTYLFYNTNLPRCNNCGKILISETSLCTDCRENPVINNIDKIIPMFSYRLWNKELLFKWKIQGYRNFAYIFAKKILEIYNEYFKDYVIVPVPPRPNKIKNQGWDQINDLMNFLRKISNIKIVNLLERTESVQQKKLNRNQRLANKESYVVKKKYLKTKLPSKIVIVDDIITTGVTLENCAIALKNLGVNTVCAITLFIAD